MKPEHAQLLRKMVDNLIKGNAQPEFVAEAQDAFHQVTVSKTRNIVENSGDPKDNKPAKDVTDSINRPKEIKDGGEEAADPKQAKSAKDVADSIKRPKEIKDGGEQVLDPKDAKAAKDVADSIKNGKEIKA
jgi:hypothetical protein